MKKWIVLSLIGVLSIITINIYNNSLEENIYITNDIIKGNKIGVYLEQDNGAFIYSDTIPKKGSGYTLDTTSSVCDGNTTINWDKNTWEVELTNITKKDLKCYLYFKKQTESEQTLDKFNLTVNTETEGCPAIGEDGELTTAIETPETEKDLLCEGKDDYGTTYYFRGIGEHNWVKISNTYWRIVRINGNGTIRLIYNGKTKNATGAAAMALTNISFNTSTNDNSYVGYMYGTPGQMKSANDDTAYKVTHANETNSNILTQIIDWYSNGDISEKVKQWIDGATGFCGDRTPYGSVSGNVDKVNAGYGGASTDYGGYVRAYKTHKPTFKCPQQEDLYTVTDSDRGNHALPVPVGLITADEVIFAGSGYYSSYQNSSYYLYTGHNYWTMSPCTGGGYARMFYVDSTGYLYDIVTNVQNITLGVRPVINLKANTPFTETGDGSADNPFEVSLTP